MFRDHGSGLLCQAKVKRRDGKWGKLSRNQMKVLPGRLPYLSLLLYEYSDMPRHNLLPFQWQSCRDVAIEDVDQWLKADAFPQTDDSETILDLLSQGAIGTDDKNIISEFICPPTRPALTIRIWWPDGGAPRSPVQVHQAKPTVHVRQGA